MITCKIKIWEVGAYEWIFKIQIPQSNCLITSDNYYQRKDAAKRAAIRIAQRLELFLKWED